MEEAKRVVTIMLVALCTSVLLTTCVITLT